MTQQRSFGADLDTEEKILKEVTELFDKVLSRQAPQNIVELWKEHGEIRRVLDHVADLQKTISDTDKRLDEAERTPEKIANFLQWADQIGVARNNCDVVVGKDHGLELKAVGPIPKSHIVVKVPRHAMISLDLARKSAILKKAFERDPIISGMGNVGLALFLAAHYLNKDQSKWYPYISVFPTKFTTSVFYTEDQLLQLKPSPIFEETLLFYRTIARQFCYFMIAVAKNRVYENVQKTARKNERAPETPILYNAPFTVANFTSRLYFWSVGVVTTRVNMVPSESEKVDDKVMMIPALIPVLDMANHENVIEGKEDVVDDLVCFSPEDDNAIITSHSDVVAGDSITIFYGKRGNGEYLLHNGFVPIRPNEFDVLKLKIGIPKTDKELEVKRKLITEFVPSVWSNSNIFQFDLFNHPEPFSPDLLRFAAIFVTQEPNEKKINTIEARKKGVDFLKTRFMLLERSYGNSIDETILSKSGLDGDISRLKATELHILRLAGRYCERLEKEIK